MLHERNNICLDFFSLLVGQLIPEWGMKPRDTILNELFIFISYYILHKLMQNVY